MKSLKIVIKIKKSTKTKKNTSIEIAKIFYLEGMEVGKIMQTKCIIFNMEFLKHEFSITLLI